MSNETLATTTTNGIATPDTVNPLTVVILPNGKPESMKAYRDRNPSVKGAAARAILHEAWQTLSRCNATASVSIMATAAERGHKVIKTENDNWHVFKVAKAPMKAPTATGKANAKLAAADARIAELEAKLAAAGIA